MKLTEVLVSIMIVMITAGVFINVLFAGRKAIYKNKNTLTSIGNILEADDFFRKKIREYEVPYWKKLDLNDFTQGCSLYVGIRQIDIQNVSIIFNKERSSEFIRIDWKLEDKKFVTQEYIRYRIFDER